MKLFLSNKTNSQNSESSETSELSIWKENVLKEKELKKIKGGTGEEDLEGDDTVLDWD